MDLDLRDYPKDYTFAEVVQKTLGIYVKLANFTERTGQKIFRMIVDPEISKGQLDALMDLVILDHDGVYMFSYLESIMADVVDHIQHRSKTTTYIRITYL